MVIVVSFGRRKEWQMIATMVVCRANNSYNKPNPSNGNVSSYHNWSHCYRELTFPLLGFGLL